MINIRNKTSTRVLSFMLAFIMLFSMLPITIFATDDPSLGNVDSFDYSYQPGDVVYPGDPDFAITFTSINGYKISVWFSDVKEVKEKEQVFYWGDEPRTEQLGETTYYRRGNLVEKDGSVVSATAFWSKGNVYSQITQQENWSEESVVYLDDDDAFFPLARTSYHLSNPNGNYWFIKSIAYAFDFAGRAGYTLYETCYTEEVISEEYGLGALQDFIRRVFNMENPDKVDLKKVYNIFAKYYAQHSAEIAKVEDVKELNFQHMATETNIKNPYNPFRRAIMDLVSEYYKVSKVDYDATWQEIEKAWSSLSDIVMLTSTQFQVPFAEATKEGSNSEKIPGNDYASAQYLKSYFLNPIVLEDLAWATRDRDRREAFRDDGKDLGGTWHVWDFIAGIYKDPNTGERREGQYKIYIEPVQFRTYRSPENTPIYGVVSWHDLMAMKKEGVHTNLISGISVAVGMFANVLTLEKEDNSLISEDGIVGSNGLTSPLTSDDINLNGSRGFWNKINDQTNTLGVGVLTSPSTVFETPPAPEIVKTYVIIKGVDSNGNFIFEKARETTKSDIDFYIDVDSNITSFPVFEEISTVEGGSIAILNDVFTTPYDLIVTEDTEWSNTDLISNAGVSLNLDSKDIAGYNFGIVTKSETFVDSYEESKKMSFSDFISSYIGLQDYVDKLYNVQASSANQLWSYTIEGGEISMDTLVEAVRYTHHLSGDASSVKLTVSELSEIDTSPYYAIVSAGMVDEESGTVVKMTEEYLEDLKTKYGVDIGLTTPANTVVLRYIIKPNPQQVNIIKYFERNEDGTLTEKETVVEDAVSLDIKGTSVTIKKPQSQLPDNAIGAATVTKWVTNSEYPIIEVEDTLPNKSSNGAEGTAEGVIINYPMEPLTHNLYVEWKVIVESPSIVVPSTADVPEWRLSKFVNSVANDADGDGSIDYSSASMSFTKKTDYGHYASSSYLTNTGRYKFDIVNPNGKKGSTTSMSSIGSVGSENIDKHYSGLTPNTWFYSKGYVVGGDFDSIYHWDNSAYIDLDATLNMVKSKDNGSLVLANWITSNSSLSGYSINSGNLPTTYTGGSQYSKYADIRLGIYNQDTYTHYYGYWGNHWYFLGICIYCGCGLGTETFSPSVVTYDVAKYGLDVTFDRYIQESTTGLTVAKEYKSENGLTSLRYQLSNTLNIYPEYGMLFEDESGTETLKWVVGDKARQIKPVVYQTLEHKVYVTPTSNGTSVATDSRGTTAASALANQDATAKGKQLIYKGAGVNTSYRLGRSSGSNNTALLTVKTYALDIGNSTLKSAWSNSSYNPYSTHSSLITNLKNDNKASITEKLLVDVKPFNSLDLDNAKKTGTSKGYNLVDYSSNSRAVDSGNAVCFEHKLIIRGGKLIGIQMMKSDGTYYKDPVTNSYSITMDTLKNVNVDLYNALVNMKLYSIEGKKDDTLLKVFEHRKGKGLNESLYITKLLEGRKSIDNLPTSAYNDVGVVLDKGWYSEDTTVLVVKEYVSNFEVPSTSVSDKLPMSIKNLTTPTNKAQFFSNIAKGYTYLKYNLNFASPSVSGIGDIDVYFEFSSYPFDDLDFGRQGVDYLVPNVSITDTTRLN